MSTAIVMHEDLELVYGCSEALIECKREQYAALTADTPKGYEEVRLAIADCRTTRGAIETTHSRNSDHERHR